LSCAVVATEEQSRGIIAWASTYSDGRLNLWSMEPDGTARQRVTNSFQQALYPSISPDGSIVAFASMDSGVWYIYLINLDGTGLKQFTTFSSAVPDWSPDILRLVFNSDHDDEPKDTPDLWEMDLDGTNLVEFIDRPPSADLSGKWSANGEQVSCSSPTGIETTTSMWSTATVLD
jgi:Tol biopolymer transport system component